MAVQSVVVELEAEVPALGPILMAVVVAKTAHAIVAVT